MRILLVIALLLMSSLAWAHKPSDSYLSLTVQQVRVEGRWDIALRDLDDAIGLDGDGNGEITWGRYDPDMTRSLLMHSHASHLRQARGVARRPPPAC